MKIIEERGRRIHVSLNLEVVREALGVSTNCVNGGISAEDACQVLYDCGHKLSNLLLSVSVLDYNPRVEDQVTGRLMVSLFYYFVLGLSQGLK